MADAENPGALGGASGASVNGLLGGNDRTENTKPVNHRQDRCTAGSAIVEPDQ